MFKSCSKSVHATLSTTNQIVSESELKCAVCGSRTSPRWRTGPEGPKTLCNKCGVYWATINNKHRWDERVAYFQGKAAVAFQDVPATNKGEEKGGGAIVSRPREGKLANGQVPDATPIPKVTMQSNVYKQAAPAVLPLKKTWQGPCPFVQGDLVESRSFDEGFRDAWFLSKVLHVKKVKGPAAYELTLQCLDFDEDEPFQCRLYQTNPGLVGPERELMVRPVPPGFHRPGSLKPEHGFRPLQGLRCQLRRSYAVGDAVEYLYNFGWWSGRISEISGHHVSIWWRPPPFGEGGEEVNISFEELRPAMTWNRGQWCLPGHPQGPLGVLVGRPSDTDSKPGTTTKVVLGKWKAGKHELGSQTRYGRMVRPKVEAREGAEGELETPKKPGTSTGGRGGNLETATKKKRERAPFRKDSVNESLSPEVRKEVARRALQEDACNPDIERLEEALRTVLGCGPPSMKKGVQLRGARWRLMLARCAETGRACPDRTRTRGAAVSAKHRGVGHASGTEQPSSVKGLSHPSEKGDVSGGPAGSVHATPDSSPLGKGGTEAKPASGFKGAIKVTPKRGSKAERTGHADLGGLGTSGATRETVSAVPGGQETTDRDGASEGDLLGELMRCFQANDQAPSPGVSSKPLPVASFTPLNVIPNEAPEGQNEAGVLRLWDVAELGGMLLDSFDPP